jgi:hypothetical protein
VKKTFIFGALILTLGAGNVFSQQLSKIELSDGSTLNAEVVSFVNGVYTFKAPDAGEIKVPADKVARIETASSASTFGADRSGDLRQAQVAAMHEKLMANPENAALVTGIAKNPNLREMANDPEILEAAKKGDIQSLLNNPKFMEIVNSPEMQDAVKKIKD